MVFSVTVQTTYRKNVEPKKSLVHFVVCGLLKVTCKKGSSMENKSEVLNQQSLIFQNFVEWDRSKLDDNRFNYSFKAKSIQII